MLNMTLEQLRATARAGGVTGVTLRGQGAGFYVEVTTRSGEDAFLSKARSASPRRFGTPTSALIVLRDIGIAVAKLDATHWDPEQKEITQNRDSRAKAMREAHEAAAWAKQLAADIQRSIDDPAPSIPHEEAMAEMDADIAALEKAQRKRGTRA